MPSCSPYCCLTARLMTTEMISSTTRTSTLLVLAAGTVLLPTKSGGCGQRRRHLT